MAGRLNLGPIHAVAFDVDGTLYDKRAATGYYARAWLRHPRLMADFATVREGLRREGFRGDLRAEESRRLGAPLGSDPERVRVVLERVIYGEFSNYLARSVGPRRGLIALLERLTNLDVGLGILSDYPSEAKLAALGLSRFKWRATLSAGCEGALKPAPEVFALLAERLGVAPERILYVGDREDSDVEGAMAAGMAAARIVDGPRLRRVRSRAAIVFSDYRELAERIAPHLGGDGV
ncbi:MAG: HAD family hydrolase [Myxococcales bacterium]|nr:HAD family hydrolase [Myxococcales bacterium]